MSFPSKIDIRNSMNNSSCYKSPMLIGGAVYKKDGRITSYAGGFASVFPFENNGDKLAVKCWSSDIGDVKVRMTTISSELVKLKLPYFLDFTFEEQGLFVLDRVQPIIVMNWNDSLDLKEFVNNNIDKPKVLLVVAENFRKMVHIFHENNIAHGDLSHGNIKVNSDLSLLVIDYDSMYVSGLEDLMDNINGMPGYQHPKRAENLNVHNKLDNFSELVIYLSLLIYSECPELWNKYYATEDFLFSRNDFAYPETSLLLQSLLSNKNPVIIYLVKYLISTLTFSSIVEIKSLEEILDERLTELANEIIDKF